MTNNAEVHHRRRSIRLQGYDYSQQGAYFVTLCTHNKSCLFGALDAGPVGANNDSPAVALNDAGMAVAKCWLEIPDHFPFVELDAFITMPDHVHGILLLTGDMPGGRGRGRMIIRPYAEGRRELWDPSCVVSKSVSPSGFDNTALKSGRYGSATITSM